MGAYLLIIVMTTAHGVMVKTEHLASLAACNAAATSVRKQTADLGVGVSKDPWKQKQYVSVDCVKNQ